MPLPRGGLSEEQDQSNLPICRYILNLYKPSIRRIAQLASTRGSICPASFPSQIELSSLAFTKTGQRFRNSPFVIGVRRIAACRKSWDAAQSLAYLDLHSFTCTAEQYLPSTVVGSPALLEAGVQLLQGRAVTAAPCSGRVARVCRPFTAFSVGPRERSTDMRLLVRLSHFCTHVLPLLQPLHNTKNTRATPPLSTVDTFLQAGFNILADVCAATSGPPLQEYIVGGAVIGVLTGALYNGLKVCRLSKGALCMSGNMQNPVTSGKRAVPAAERSPDV